MRIPKPWSALENWDEGAVAIVVPTADTRPAAALRVAIEMYAGDDVPVEDLTEHAKTLSVEQWRYCSKKWVEAEEVEGYDQFWAPDGDGKTTIWAVDLSDIDLYGFGDENT